MDDVGTGCWVYLGQFSDVTSLLGAFPGDDPVSANAGKPWLFTDTAGDQVLVRVEGTSSCAVVLGDFGGWGVPPQLGTQRFRRLRVDIWVDPLRDADQSVTETSEATTNRGLAVFNAIQFRLQRTDPDLVFWGDMATNGCQLLTEPQFAAVPDGDWCQRGTAYYGVSFTGWSDASE
jgi:hypothetical protein